MNRENKNSELSERDRLDILLRYQRIKDNVGDESLQDLCQEYRITREYPSRLKRRYQERGLLKSQQRSGRPSKVKDPVFQNRTEELIRMDRRRNSTCRRLGRLLNSSHDVANRTRKALKMKICQKVSRPPLSQQNIQRRAEFVDVHPRCSR